MKVKKKSNTEKEKVEAKWYQKRRGKKDWNTGWKDVKIILKFLLRFAYKINPNFAI